VNTTDTELDRLLAAWAARHRLTDVQVSEVRARVLAAVPAEAEALDAEWLWRFLRPVTALLDRLDDDEPMAFGPGRASEWRTYLQLA
jgi:hypothetical protein